MDSKTVQTRARAGPPPDFESPVNILIVDDQPQNLVVMDAILSPLNQNLVYARSGQEALRHLFTMDFALILLDVQMPTMDGFEMARIVRQRERARCIPIIFITAISTDQRFVMEGYAAGAVDYLFKPFNPQVLVSKVSVFVELHRQRRQIEAQAQALRDAELRDAARTFRQRERNRRLRETRDSVTKQMILLQDVLAGVTGGKLNLCASKAQLPRRLPLFGKAMALSPAAVHRMRRLTEQAAAAAGLPTERRHDLLTAVSEAVTNGVVHAGHGTACVAASETGTVQAWIQDRGAGIDINQLPRATLERGFTTAGTLGHGFWLMLQTVDRLSLFSNASGTTVVLEQDAIPPEPHWQRK